MACGDTAYKRHRGLVSIAFFHLDDHRRKYLFRERANVIVSLHAFLDQAENAEDLATREVYEDLVEAFTKPSAPHTNCAQSFRDVYNRDRREAEELFQFAAEYIRSISD